MQTKGYVHKNRKSLEIREGDYVFLKINLTTDIGRVMKSKKFAPQFVSPYQILEK